MPGGRHTDTTAKVRHPNAHGNAGSQATIYLVQSAIRGLLASCTVGRFRSLSRLPHSNLTSSVLWVSTILIRAIACRSEKTLRGTIQNWRDIFRTSLPIRVFLTACPRRWRVAWKKDHTRPFPNVIAIQSGSRFTKVGMRQLTANFCTQYRIFFS